MAKSLTVTKVVRQNGKAYIRFSNKTELEFDSVQQAKDHVRSIIDSEELLMALAVARAIALADDGSAIQQLEGKVFTLNMTAAANLVRVA